MTTWATASCCQRCTSPGPTTSSSFWTDMGKKASTFGVLRHRTSPLTDTFQDSISIVWGGRRSSSDCGLLRTLDRPLKAHGYDDLILMILDDQRASDEKQLAVKVDDRGTMFITVGPPSIHTVVCQ